MKLRKYVPTIQLLTEETAMTNIQVDFSKTNGPIKAMNAVNNGPVSKSVRGMSNFEDYKALEIPYARNHDASFNAEYGGEHTVDGRSGMRQTA